MPPIAGKGDRDIDLIMGEFSSELRKDPTRAHRVLVRPPSAALPSDDGCPFCPGHEPLTPPEIQAYRKEGSSRGGPGWSVRVIPEAGPYFRIEMDLGREGIGLYDKISPRGATELIIESPVHDATPATLGESQWEQVLWMYGDRIPRSQARPRHPRHPGHAPPSVARLPHRASLLACDGHPHHLR
jgi:galactose-1-phosphate uridylyltransferase